MQTAKRGQNMREIKFRAWDGEEMWTGFHILPSDIIVPPAYRKHPDTKLEFMQFTGLKDKSGKEVYEGDILRFSPTNGYEKTTFNAFEVFWHDNDAAPDGTIGWHMNRMHPQGNSAGGVVYKFLPRNVSSMEVIGNIYENPELIERKI
jgi:uncharacterized phage protein (TIGR01671 family)